MSVAVFDTYVKKSDGNTAHFDIIVPDGQYSLEEVIDFGKAYLTQIQVDQDKISAKECQFCHIEEPSEEILNSIAEKGYYILEMEDIPSILPSNPSRRNLIQHLRAQSEAHRFANFQGVSNSDIQKLIGQIS